MQITLNNGETRYVKTVYDMLRIVREEFSEELSSELSKTQEALDNYKRGEDNDLLAYESELDNYNSVCCDVVELADSLLDEISKERLNRKKIKSIAEEIRYTANI